MRKDLARITPETESSNSEASRGLSKSAKKHKSNFNVLQPSTAPSATDLAGMDFSHLKSICIIMEFVVTDLDQILKHKIDFTEHHLLKVVYSSLAAIFFCKIFNYNTHMNPYKF